MIEAFICDAIRTPIGRYGGALSSVRPDDLAAVVLRELTKRNSELDPKAVDDVILGCANQAGEDNRNVARMSALLAGLPADVPGATINRLCGSGLDAVASASRMIGTGEADIVIAGGVESMSRAPYVMSKSAAPFARDVQMFDTTIGWRFANPLIKKNYGIDSMPETGENVAEQFRVSREDQDRFALRSQQRALAAQAARLFAAEIVAVAVPAKRGETTLGSDPVLMLTAPAPASEKALRLAGMTARDIDLWEINEAFAAVVLQTTQKLAIDPARVNVNGGAIALGHPLGATGAMLLGTALDELERRGLATALVTMCIGGGQGIATILERI